MRFTIRDLWNALGNINVHEDEDGALVTEQQFLHFPPGTDREDIWHWFEETFDIVLGEWIFSGKEGR